MLRDRYRNMSLAEFSVAMLLGTIGYFFLLFYICSGDPSLKRVMAWWLPLLLWFGIINYAFGRMPLREYYKAIYSPKGPLQKFLLDLSPFGALAVPSLGQFLEKWFDVLL